MHILIIGSNGFIARHLRSHWLRKGTGSRVPPAIRRRAISCATLRHEIHPPMCGEDGFQAFDAVINCAGLLAGSPAAMRACGCAPAAIADGVRRDRANRFSTFQLLN